MGSACGASIFDWRLYVFFLDDDLHHRKPPFVHFVQRNVRSLLGHVGTMYGADQTACRRRQWRFLGLAP